jgi:type II secretory pathway pseudopilin PulG
MRMACLIKRRDVAMEPQGEEGFMLVGLIVAIFFILLALSVAAPKVAKELRRDREVEAIHRGNQYVRALRLYYKKTGTYPGSMEQLEKTNNVRYLRQRYVDPITGKVDWRLIHVGEAKTTVKGFFGKPLTGLTTGLGSAAGMVSPGATGGAGQQTGTSSAFGSSAFGSSSPGTGPGSSSPGTGGFGTSSPGTGSAFGGSSPSGGGLGSTTSGATGTSDGSGTSSTNSTLGSAAGMASSGQGTGMTSIGAPFVGVGIPKDGDSIAILNEQTTYNTWEFIYDPRIEQLYAKAALFGGGSSTGTSGLGSASSMTSGAGGTNSGFGGTSTTPGMGSPPGTTTPTTPTTPPQQPQ